MPKNKIVILEIVAINGDRYHVKFPDVNVLIEMDLSFLQKFIKSSKYRIVRKFA